MNFTLDNHLKYWIGSGLYGTRGFSHEPYRVQVGSVDPDRYANSTWQEEQTRTAQLISEDLGRDFAVMFSGGSDSEIVLRSFKKIGVSPRVIFIRFSDDLNVNDYYNALRACHEIGLTLESVEFDVRDFYHSGAAAEFAREIQCRQIAYLTVYHHVRKLGMPAVMGGEMLLRRRVRPNQDSEWYYVFRENEDASAMRFSLKYNIPLINEWFSYTPEMMAYYLEHEKIQWLISDRYNYKLGSVSTKNSVLKELQPDLIDKVKTHGFERLIGFNQMTYDALLAQQDVKRLENSLDGIAWPEFKRQLYANIQHADS